MEPQNQRPPDLVDELETAFQNSLSALTSQEFFNISDQDEVKTSVDMAIQNMLDVAKKLESHFLQKRIILSVQKPEQFIKDDMKELTQELRRKEALIQKHYSNLQQWQLMLNRVQGGSAAGSQQGDSGKTTNKSPSSGTNTNQSVSAYSGTASQLPNKHNLQGFQQGPLSYMEQSASNIGQTTNFNQPSNVGAPSR